MKRQAEKVQVEDGQAVGSLQGRNDAIETDGIAHQGTEYYCSNIPESHCHLLLWIPMSYQVPLGRAVYKKKTDKIPNLISQSKQNYLFFTPLLSMNHHHTCSSG